jgi:hypothetical protein
MTNKDPAMIASGFPRRDGDRYWTEPWVTRALLQSVFGDVLQRTGGTVWEPACGRGDMVRELMDHELEVVASDIDLSDFENEFGCEWIEAHQRDFLNIDSLLDPPDVPITAIITNPPYGQRATDFIRRALEHMDADDNIKMVSMILRSEYYHGSGKRDGRDEFFDRSDFQGILALTARPRWDDWLNKPKPDNGPRHNYSWYTWSDAAFPFRPVIRRGGKL